MDFLTKCFLNFKLTYSIVRGGAETAKVLLKDPRVDNNLAIKWATRGGHVETAKTLLTIKHVDPSDAIGWAALGGHVECVRLLLANKHVDPSARDNYAIKLAATWDHTDCVKALLTDKRVWFKTLPVHPTATKMWSNNVQTLLMILFRKNMGSMMMDVLRDIYIEESLNLVTPS